MDKHVKHEIAPFSEGEERLALKLFHAQAFQNRALPLHALWGTIKSFAVDCRLSPEAVAQAYGMRHVPLANDVPLYESALSKARLIIEDDKEFLEHIHDFNHISALLDEIFGYQVVIKRENLANLGEGLHQRHYFMDALMHSGIAYDAKEAEDLYASLCEMAQEAIERSIGKGGPDTKLPAMYEPRRLHGRLWKPSQMMAARDYYNTIISWPQVSDVIFSFGQSIGEEEIDQSTLKHLAITLDPYLETLLNYPHRPGAGNKGNNNELLASNDEALCGYNHEAWEKHAAGSALLGVFRAIFDAQTDPRMHLDSERLKGLQQILVKVGVADSEKNAAHLMRRASHVAHELIKQHDRDAGHGRK